MKLPNQSSEGSSTYLTEAVLQTQTSSNGVEPARMGPGHKSPYSSATRASMTEVHSSGGVGQLRVSQTQRQACSNRWDDNDDKANSS